MKTQHSTEDIRNALIREITIPMDEIPTIFGTTTLL
jgi:chorismate-pyruvate lyase